MKINPRLILLILLVIFTISIASCVTDKKGNTSNNSSVGQINTTTLESPSALVLDHNDGKNTTEPIGIYITTNSNSIHLNGDTSIIAVQLFDNNMPLKMKGVNITFTIDNNTIADLPSHNYNTTDENGIAIISITSNNTPGIVKVTAFYNDNNRVISNCTYVNVYRWGTIAGLVIDKNGNGIPNVNVSLNIYSYSNSNKKWENDGLISIPDNPQLSNEGSTGPAGLFTFTLVPTGTYNVSAMISVYNRNGSNQANFSIITIDQGSATCIITIPDYEELNIEHSYNIPSPQTDRGTIWGIISDRNNIGWRNANVTLWHCDYDIQTQEWKRTNAVNIPDNPQFAGNGNENTWGVYRFNNVPQGTYYITAESLGYSYYAIVRLDSNSKACFVGIPESISHRSS
jgi:hypothetical protein